MNLFLKATIALLAYIAAVSFYKNWNSSGAVSLSDDLAPGADLHSKVFYSVPEQPAAQQTAQRIQQLELQDKHLQRMAVATREMRSSRQQAQFASHQAWSQVVETNQGRYQQLLLQAHQQARGEVACTICDGLSYMACVMCAHHDGKCATCEGRKYLTQDVYCPTCLGSGRCYLCCGSGKMFCPFCDDGMIKYGRPPPSSSPPLE